jgi:hypothetical protein
MLLEAQTRHFISPRLTRAKKENPPECSRLSIYATKLRQEKKRRKPVHNIGTMFEISPEQPQIVVSM